MADQQFNITDSQIAIVTSRPDMLVRHSISDEELDVLCNASGSARDQVISVSAGALFGSAPSALPGIVGLWGGQAQNVATLLQCVVLVGAAAAIIVVLYATRGQKTKAENLLERIRGRIPSSS